VSPVRYVLGFYIPEDDILHSDRRENLKPFKVIHSKFRVYVSVAGAVASLHAPDENCR
jgi:hypothetical protein